MKRTIKIFSLPTACVLGGAVRRAALMLLVTLLTTMTAWADDVTYIDEDGDLQTVDANPLDYETDEWEDDVWYYVDGPVEIYDRIEIFGTVNLILCDDCEMNVYGGIHLANGCKLNIFAGVVENTEDDIECSGHLCVKQLDNERDAAIGGNGGDDWEDEFISSDGEDSGELNIYGGHIEVDGNIGGGKGSAAVEEEPEYEIEGVNAGHGGHAGSIRIYGGEVTVNGNLGGGDGGDAYFDDGDGGDGGDGGSADNIEIYGGKVTVYGTIGGGAGGGGDSNSGGDGDAMIWLSLTNIGDKMYAERFRGTIYFDNAIRDEDGNEWPMGEYGSDGFGDVTLHPAIYYGVNVDDGNDPECLLVSEGWSMAGTEITLTAINGYVINSITVVDEDDNSVDMTNNNDGTWTFTMPESDVTVTPEATRTYYAIRLPYGFTLSVEDGEDNTIVQEGKTYYKSDANVTVTLPTVPEGYSLVNFGITDGNGAVGYTQTDNTCTFTMPSSNVTVSGLLGIGAGSMTLLTGTDAFTVTRGTSDSSKDYPIEGWDADSGEGCTRLLDGLYDKDDIANYSKWCLDDFKTCINNFGSCYVEFHTKEPVVPASYVLITGNDNTSYLDRNPKTWTIKAKLNADDAWTTIADVSNDKTLDVADYTPYTFAFDNDENNAYQYFRFDIYEIGNMMGNVMQLSELQILVRNTQSLTANLADDSYWTTFYDGEADYQINAGENACAYTATVSGETITLHKLGKVIPKQTAVIIVGEDNTIGMTSTTAEAESTVSNDLQGVDEDTETAELGTGTFYVLGNKNNHFGFHKYTGTTMAAHKAYLMLGNSNARSLSFAFEDATGLCSIDNGEWIMDNSVYDLQGRKLANSKLSNGQMQKGVYVVNGKKVIVK